MIAIGATSLTFGLSLSTSANSLYALSALSKIMEKLFILRNGQLMNLSEMETVIGVTAEPIPNVDLIEMPVEKLKPILWVAQKEASGEGYIPPLGDKVIIK